MRLIDLDPVFLQSVDEHKKQLVSHIAVADGVQFVCPKCLFAKGMWRPGVHSIVCWRPRVPAHISPGPGRWELHGTGFADLSLVAPSPSVSLLSGCKAHFHVRKGQVKNCEPVSWERSP
jgi:hypothetical protein